MATDSGTPADHVECISCPVHGDGETPRDHDEWCNAECADTHAYWRSSLPLEDAYRAVAEVGERVKL